MLLERAFFIQLISNFMKNVTNLVFLVYCHLAVNGSNGGVKNKMLNNGSILTGKVYVVQMYQIKLHTKNHVDWIKNEVPREV